MKCWWIVSFENIYFILILSLLNDTWLQNKICIFEKTSTNILSCTVTDYPLLFQMPVDDDDIDLSDVVLDDEPTKEEL